VGCKIARLLRKIAIMPIAIAIQANSLLLRGKRKNINTPIVKNRIEASAIVCSEVLLWLATIIKKYYLNLKRIQVKHLLLIGLKDYLKSLLVAQFYIFQLFLLQVQLTNQVLHNLQVIPLISFCLNSFQIKGRETSSLTVRIILASARC
jgi:hypothetical protein